MVVFVVLDVGCVFLVVEWFWVCVCVVGLIGVVFSFSLVKSYWGWLVMGEFSREEYKIQFFDVEIQQLLKIVFKDLGVVDLEKVVNVIVDYFLQDCVFSKEVGCMCYVIIQVESK